MMGTWLNRSGSPLHLHCTHVQIPLHGFPSWRVCGWTRAVGSAGELLCMAIAYLGQQRVKTASFRHAVQDRQFYPRLCGGGATMLAHVGGAGAGARAGVCE